MEGAILEPLSIRREPEAFDRAVNCCPRSPDSIAAFPSALQLALAHSEPARSRNWLLNRNPNVDSFSRSTATRVSQWFPFRAAASLGSNDTPGYWPKLRTWGTGLPNYQAGWFLLQNGEKALLFVTDWSRTVAVSTNSLRRTMYRFCMGTSLFPSAWSVLQNSPTQN